MSLTQPSNVTKLNQSSVYADILSFLNNKGLRSLKTKQEYESDVRQFFLYTRNKPIEQLIITDLRFKNAEMIDYQYYLSTQYINPTTKKGYKNTSVNRKIASIQSLYMFLRKNDYDVNVEAMKLDLLSDDSEGYGFLTFEEAEHLALLALNERQKGNEKHLIIKLATRTSLREKALLTLKWGDIRVSEDDSNVYKIQVSDSLRQDKGKRIYKEISKIMYDMLLKIRNNKSDNDYIFTLDAKYMPDMMNRLTSMMNIDSRRNIKFHSLKKAGVNYVYEITNGDIYAASAQAQHSSITTTAKYYVKQKKNMAGVLMDQNLSDSILDDATKEELLFIIKEKINKNVLMNIKNEYVKLLEKKDGV